MPASDIHCSVLTASRNGAHELSKNTTAPAKPTSFLRRFFSALGPGLTTGAADDDPSGVATYAIAGAQLGTSILWTALITWPLMAAVQMMCARIGLVTGDGLAGALRRKIPQPLLICAVFALLIANAINIAADLSGMAAATEMLTGFSSHVAVIVFGIGSAYATVRFRYRHIAAVLKWLAAALLAYVIAGFVIAPDWSTIARDTFVPTLPRDSAGWATLVAILGTTISPYLFFWQTSQEVEEEKALGRLIRVRASGATRGEISTRKLDVATGTFFSNLVMYFIILTTASTLHRAGVMQITTADQAAEALRPLAGNFAALLFTLGIVGAGLLAIPTLAGSAAYAIAETFQWREGLDEKFKSARAFYAVLIGSTLLGIIIHFGGVSPVRALFWSAVINGLLAPFLLLGVMFVACDRALMHAQSSSLLGRLGVALATIAMFAAGIAMFLV